MYIDFHTHGKLAKKIPFTIRYVDWLFREAKAAGLDAFCLTEHSNTFQFEELYRYIASVGRQDGDTLILNGLRIFPGMEIDVAEGGHMLTIGSLEVIMELHSRLENTQKREPLFSELMDMLEQYPVLSGAAHPFRNGGHIPELPREQLLRLHFLDLNGKDMAQSRDRIERLTYGLGQSLNIPVVGGSDTHQAAQYGCICSCFEKDCVTVSQLRQEMLEGRYRVELRPDAAFRVKTAGQLKRALKAVHSLGGDYVSVLLGEENA